MKAKDVMTTDVVTVKPETSVDEVARLLIEERIGGVPVVDDAGNIVGMVSDGDLMRRAELGTEASEAPAWQRPFDDQFKVARRYAKSHGHHARDVMTGKVLTVDENTPLREVAALLEKHRIKRVPVMRLGRMVGIVSRANLLQGLAARGTAVVPTGPTDEELRRRVLDAVRSQSWANLRTTNVTVTSGVAEIWGLIADESMRDAWRVAVENVPGIVKVIDHRSLLPTVGEWIFGVAT
jgi:CBS-domain-containing membrane protein